jgi:hypothetical protein
MTEWDSLTLDDDTKHTGSNKSAAEIDAILTKKVKHVEHVDTHELDSAFDDIGSELTGGEAKYEWSKEKHEAVESQFDDVATLMDAIEIQDHFLDNDTGSGDASLQAQYKANIAKLTKEIDKMGAATSQIGAATSSSGQARKKVSTDDAQGLSSAMSSVNAMLASTPAVTSSQPRAQPTFQGADNLPPDKLAKLKPAVLSGIVEIIAELNRIKERVIATADLTEAVSLTAPLAGAREDFHLMAKLCDKPTTLPKLELNNMNVYKVSVSRLAIAMRNVLDGATSECARLSRGARSFLLSRRERRDSRCCNVE